MSVLARASARHALRHPWQLGLSLLGMSLGVAVVIAVDLSIESARRAFDLGGQRVAGRATHHLRGGPGGIPEAVYARLRARWPALSASPVVEGTVAASGRDITLLGVDPFADAPFRDYAAGDGLEGEALRALLVRPGSVMLGADVARGLGVATGDAFAVTVGAAVRRLRVAGPLPARDALERALTADLAVADIATAQEALGRTGRLDRIDLRLDGVAGGGATERGLRAWLPPGLVLRDAGERSRGARRMTRAFNLNLRMLSMLALVVGGFLIFNTMSFAVVQRRVLIGHLRALGVTRAQVLAMVLGEAAVVGLAGAALGFGLGVLLAGELVGLVTRTINDLYFAVSVRDVTVSVESAARAVGLGWVTAVGAAGLPALEATRVPPRAAQTRSHAEVRERAGAPRAALAGAVLALACPLLLAVPARGPGTGFAALFVLVGAAALVIPAVTRLLLAILAPVGGWLAGRVGRLAVRGVTAGLSRSGVAVAALSVALAATVGVSTMVDSFRRSVAEWLHAALRADVYVGAPGEGADRSLPPDLLRRLESLPEVAGMSLGRAVRVQAPEGTVEVLALKMAPQSYAGFDLLQGDPRVAWPAFDRAEAVMVSEPLAYRRGLRPGDAVDLVGDHGPVRFPVAGVYRDYGSDQGKVLMSREAYDARWRDRAVSAAGLYAAPGVSTEALLAATRGAVAPAREIRVRSNRAIREASLAVFDRTFTITAVLRTLATAVAFVGVLSALMSLQMERAREVAILRAQGMTRGQVWGLVQAQTAVLGLVAGLLSLPLGLAVSVLLVQVINRRSFGWSMDLHLDPALPLGTLGLACTAALLAGLYPAWRMARTLPALALRED